MALNDYRALFIRDQLGGTFSRGAWLEALPLSNLLVPRFEFAARSVDLSPDSTKFRFALRAPASLGAICLAWTNLTPDATVDIEFLSSADASLHAASLTPIPDDPDPWRSPSVFHVLPGEAAGVKYVDVAFDDQGNPAGYVQLSLCFVGSSFQPSINYSPDGNGLSFRSDAIVSPTLSATSDAVSDKAERRVWRAPWQYLDEAEVYGGDGFAALRAFRRGALVVAIPQADASPLVMQRKAFVGQVTSRDPISQAAPAYDSFGLEVTEVMGPRPIVIEGAFVGVPTDAMTMADYPPATEASVFVPLDAMIARDYPATSAAGAAAYPPANTMTAADYPPRVAIGAVGRPPLDAMSATDFVIIPAAGKSVAIPSDIVVAVDYALDVQSGATVLVPLDAMEATDYSPISGAATIVEITTDAMTAADYAPDVSTGTAAVLPVDAMTAADYVPAFGGGASVAVSAADAMTMTDYSPRVPGFSSAFDGGFQ